MIDGKTVVALVPARGGSKGLLRKNVMPVAGLPLIAWSIRCAGNSKYIDRTIVSTDDKEIADVARQYGADVPFMRPEKLATDGAKQKDVILHAIDWLVERKQPIDFLLLLQPTAVMRLPRDIDAVIEQLVSGPAKVVVSVCVADCQPYLMNAIPEDLCLKDFQRPEEKNKNRQDFPTYYRLNGVLYVGYWDYIKTNDGLMGDQTYAYIMPNDRSIDIDSEIDIKFAELLIREKPDQYSWSQT